MSWSFNQIYIICPHACMLSHFSCVQLFANLWIIPHLTPLSKGFSRQEYWSGLPCPDPQDSPQLRDQTHVSCGSFTAGEFFTTEPPGKPQSLPIATLICYLLRLWHLADDDIIYSCIYSFIYTKNILYGRNGITRKSHGSYHQTVVGTSQESQVILLQEWLLSG